MKEPVKATVVENAFESDIAGAFEIAVSGRWITFICPCGCGQCCRLPLHTKTVPGPGWEWDGSREAPTLQPSIRDLSHCYFHGHLRGGQWTFEADTGQRL